jgi:hypothetical protein
MFTIGPATPMFFYVNRYETLHHLPTLDFRCCAGSCNIASSQIRSAVSLGRILLGLAHRGDSNSALCESRATSKVIGGDEGAGTKGGSALGERERVLPLLTGARSRFLEYRVGDSELAMPLATESGAVEQPKVDFLGL